MNNYSITFISSPTAGGAERMTLLYAKILYNHGYNCEIVMTQFANDKVLLTNFIPKNISQTIIKCVNRHIFPYQLAWHIHCRKSDIVFCSQPGNTKRLLQMKRLGLIRSKVVFRDYLMPHDQIKRNNESVKRLFPFADMCIAQTQEMKDEMILYYGLKPEKVQVINNPIDKILIKEKIKETFSFDHSYTNYVAINRVEPQKDIATLLRAFAIVKKIQHKSRLYICGNDSNAVYKNKMLALCETFNITDDVFFEGPQSNPFKYVDHADVFVLSSIYEGLPNGMLEAMYLGIPVVVTRSIPFVSQVVQEGVHGFTVEIGDYKAFADAMIKAKDLQIKTKFVDITRSEESICYLFDSLLK